MTISFRTWVKREQANDDRIADVAPGIIHDEYWPEGSGSLGRYEHRFREGGADEEYVELLRYAWEAYTISVGDPRSPFVPVGPEALKAVLREHPTLNDGGYGQPNGITPTLNPPRLDDVRAAARWIRRCVWTTPGDHGSYGLKHVMEPECGVYVTNGAFIAAALAVGCPVQLGGYNPPVGIRLWRTDRRPGHPGIEPHWSVKEWGHDEPGRALGMSAAEYADGGEPLFVRKEIR